MRHGMKRRDPKGVGEKLKAERAARGVPELPENAEYEAERAKVLATKKDRQRAQAQKRKRDAELKKRGIDPARHVSPEMLDVDEQASKKLGVPSMREQQRAAVRRTFSRRAVGEGVERDWHCGPCRRCWLSL